ncbi:hypothetical protein GWO43_28460 [candidate division KSB1 bacterium]|nr:hypothetical protein [candidate division KSB1 bacterium]NIR70828.1 hypothetical protein [candidate division KSB1 bacterium]NIS27840.1 hypothetical protein [candidate division KSB1 bacterium]NIT74722.1 hypothetical protein [candidate division KSB1 bacterium]NIU28505.1 hypothetical protein [candidate division KSB1 bacterium]
MIMKAEPYSKEKGGKFHAKASSLELVTAILKNSAWLLSRSLKIIFILNRDMLTCLFKGSNRRRYDVSKDPNIVNHYGIWFIDLHGLIHEQMGIK